VIKPPNKRKLFEMLKPQVYILQEILLSPLTVLFNPIVRLLKISFCREKKDNLESFCSSGIFSLIMWTRLPYSGPSRNWGKASRLRRDP
jgi:hypothetical protein